jgi:hypothetical protein
LLWPGGAFFASEFSWQLLSGHHPVPNLNRALSDDDGVFDFADDAAVSLRPVRWRSACK